MKNPERTLYGSRISGHSHRVELFLSILGLPFERVEVELFKGAHKEPAFLAKNPFGQVPVLEDGELTLSDSNAILVYLASKYDASQKWYPRDPVVAARIQRWFSVAAGELQNGAGTARRVVLLGANFDHDRAKTIAKNLFTLMNGVLETSPYFANDEPTLADIALYSYTALAPEGHVELEAWPNVRAWLGRIERIEGFVPVPRTNPK